MNRTYNERMYGIAHARRERQRRASAIAVITFALLALVFLFLGASAHDAQELSKAGVYAALECIAFAFAFLALAYGLDV